MALPSWFLLNGKNIFLSGAIGITAAGLAFYSVSNAKCFAVDTYKGCSALYAHKKVPQGEDPWKY